MKKSILALAVALSITACERENEDQAKAGIDIVIPSDTIRNHTTIHFVCSPYSIRSMTRAALSDLSLTDLWIFDYIGDELQATTHQSSSDAVFGLPSVDLDFGTHTLYFVASRGDTPSIDDHHILWSRPSDTFWKTITLTVAPQTPTTQSVVLERVITRLRIAATDEVPATLSKLTITPARWYYGIDYITSEPVSPQQTPRSVSVPSSYIGTTGNLAMSIYGFCSVDGFTTDVIVSAQDATDADIANITLSDVPLERNRITNYSGSIFTAGRSISISADDEWNEEYNVTW